ncbi:unnamed protein product, partial [Mesorhabditis belari]|uniref:Uncharacterized protein n=1 Tax=Mesorhabditis belari TaxID=2138241 RepID=A0AAF3EB62_9BILA
MILWPTFHRRITHLHIHKAMLGQLFMISSIMIVLIIYWSQVNDVETSILCSSGAYPSLINRVEGTMNITISSFAMLFYIPVLFQIKKVSLQM